jgi:addiction module HigA family antidote
MTGTGYVFYGKTTNHTMWESWIITRRSDMAIVRDPKRRPPPMHPGEILREEFMIPNGITANGLAMALRVPSTRILEIVKERRGVTADTAYRLAFYFGTSADLWMNLQTSYELACVERAMLPKIRKEVQRRVA